MSGKQSKWDPPALFFERTNHFGFEEHFSPFCVSLLALWHHLRSTGRYRPGGGVCGHRQGERRLRKTASYLEPSRTRQRATLARDRSGRCCFHPARSKSILSRRGLHFWKSGKSGGTARAGNSNAGSSSAVGVGTARRARIQPASDIVVSPAAFRRSHSISSSTVILGARRSSGSKN